MAENDTAREPFDGLFDGSELSGECAVDDAKVFFLVCAVTHLAGKKVLDIWIQRKYNDAGSIPVQPADRAYQRSDAPGDEIMHESVCQSAGIVAD